ncbi:MAG: TonB-dependent receptor plug domain-containing protein, partial [Phascolarctobacterium sp.]|nr:TonB-dependent receptor plug domain-containing protein [Phascolarctobacterium sp.]
MKKMSKGMLMTALICGAVYLGGSPVYASELQEFSLDEYVVTAARTETKLVDTPANISVVDAQTIEERHYQDVSEVLKDVPGAVVIDTGMGAFEKAIKLNGDERVLVLVDGRRINSDLGLTNSARASVDMNQLPDVGIIERIEILKGAGGALYGSEAVGGVINIITKKADSDYGKVSVAFGSHDARDLNTMYSFKKGKTGVTVAASKVKQGYYEYRDKKTDTSKRWPGNSNYENNKISLKVEQEISYNKNLTFGYDYSKFEGTNFGNLNAIWSAETKLDKQSDNFYVKYDWMNSANNLGYLQVYHNKNEYNNYATGNEGFFEEKVWGVDGQQEISLSDTNKMVVGAS